MIRAIPATPPTTPPTILGTSELEAALEGSPLGSVGAVGCGCPPVNSPPPPPGGYFEAELVDTDERDMDDDENVWLLEGEYDVDDDTECVDDMEAGLLVDVEEFKVDKVDVFEDSEGGVDWVLEGIEESFDDEFGRMEVDA